MKRLPWIFGAVIVAAAAMVGGVDVHRGVRDWSTMGPLPPGRTAPAFHVVMLDGTELGADDLRGKVSVLTFWATWCGVCKGELDDLDDLDARYSDDDVRFVAINREGDGVGLAQARAMVEQYRRHRELDLTFALDDGSMERTFRVGPIPHTVLLDRSGTVRHVHQGRVASATLTEEIDALLAR